MSGRRDSAPPGPLRVPAVSRRFVGGVVAVDAVALAVVVLAWWKASAAVRVADALPWVGVSIAALAVAGCGHAALLLRLRLGIGQQHRRLEAGRFAVQTAAPADAAADVDADLRSDAATALPALVAAPAMRRYHRSGCRLATGKVVQAASAAEHQRAGRNPCAVCRPPGPSPDGCPPAATAVPIPAPPPAVDEPVEERASR